MDPKVPILGALEFVVLLSKGDGITNHSDFNLVQETEDFLGPQPPILGALEFEVSFSRGDELLRF